MTKILYQNARFLLSVANSEQLPPDQGGEIAFVGRSNSGKSSVLNYLTHQNKLARVSNTPGRTQLINYFEIDDQHRLVDLPGYGFAKVPPAVKRQWEKLIDNYLRNRQSLKALVLIMDIRHPLKEIDKQVLAWTQECNLPVHILLNKSDKLAQNKVKQTEQALKQAITSYGNQITAQSFSALKKIGVDELKKILNTFFTKNLSDVE